MGRNAALDSLKLLLALMVVGIHTEFFSDVSDRGSWLMTNGLFRVAVPIFLLINGFFFYSVISGQRVAPWFKRCLLLYGFWMLCYAPFWMELSSVTTSEILRAIQRVIFGFYHLWYIAGMLVAAAIMVVLKGVDSFRLLIMLIVAFLTGVAIQYGGNYHMFENPRLDHFLNYNWMHRNGLLFSFPFFAAGYLIHRHQWHLKVSLPVVLALVVLGVVLMLAESYGNFVGSGGEGGVDNLLSLAILAPAVFILFVKVPLPGDSKRIALCSSAVYFVHPLFSLPLQESTDLPASWLTMFVSVLSLIAACILIPLNRRMGFVL